MVFDAGETLVHPSPSFPELFVDVLRREGVERTTDAVVNASGAVFQRFSEAARDDDLWTTSPERSARFWHGVYERMLTELGLPSDDGLPGRMYETFTDLGNYALFDDVLPALDALEAQGLVLAIVSNFEAWLDDLLRVLGVRDRFVVRVISGIEGVEKPDVRIFEAALDRLGVRPDEAVYVGDNPEFDVEPAELVGMASVLIDRRGRFPGHTGRVVRDLRHLATMLEFP